MTVIAIDWSGRDSIEQIHHIRAAVIRSDGDIEIWSDLTRNDVIIELLDLSEPVVVGFDFSFGFPRWVGDWHECSHGPNLWPIVAMHSESWLLDCPPPFFAKHGVRRVDVPLLRDCDRALGAKSVFQIAGAGHVGTGSLRGMPLLIALREAGFSVWPFDDAGKRTVVEIYPRVLRPLAREPTLPRRIQRAVENSDDTRDAVLSALVMWEHRASFAARTQATDPTTRIEGDVWIPTRSSP